MRKLWVRYLIKIVTNGLRISMPISRTARLNILGNQVIRNIKVPILPDQTRNILGLNILKKAALFRFLMEPTAMILNHCEARGSLPGSVTQRNTFSTPALQPNAFPASINHLKLRQPCRVTLFLSSAKTAQCFRGCSTGEKNINTNGDE